MEEPAHVYVLRCVDGSYYVGKTQKGLESRIGEHNAGAYPGYTAKRRPVVLAWAQEFERYDDACSAERRIKGWSRAKKEALVRGDWNGVSWWAKRPSARASSFGASLGAARHRMKPSFRATFDPFILRCERSEPRRMKVAG